LLFQNIIKGSIYTTVYEATLIQSEGCINMFMRMVMLKN